ncbi:hypothetical protein BH10PSE13_BH10PSE13_23150 [soil metagenome]
MTRLYKLLMAAGGVVLAAPLAFMAAERMTPAADHLDPPTRTDPAVDTNGPDVPADIADVYAWYTPTKVIIAYTFAGPKLGDRPATYDRDVLYGINISNSGNKSAPTSAIRFRFGVDTSSGSPQYGVQVSGLPGVTGNIVGPVEQRLEKDGVIVQAGLFDDPFVFDLQGFRTTTATATLSFSNTRNFFATQNDTAIVVEIPRDRLQSGTNPLGIYVTSARFGGNI